MVYLVLGILDNLKSKHHEPKSTYFQSPTLHGRNFWTNHETLKLDRVGPIDNRPSTD